jgi:hypothetical protein
MENDTNNTRLNIRESLIDLLDLLSDKNKQIEYAKTVGDKVAIDELVCMWFDDQYKPDSEIFIAAYNDKELVVLKKFNDYYYSISNKIPEDTIDKLLVDPNWVELIRQACDAKAELIKK